jgi:hypothetical protein
MKSLRGIYANGAEGEIETRRARRKVKTTWPESGVRGARDTPLCRGRRRRVSRFSCGRFRDVPERRRHRRREGAPSGDAGNSHKTPVVVQRRCAGGSTDRMSGGVMTQKGRDHRDGGDLWADRTLLRNQQKDWSVECGSSHSVDHQRSRKSHRAINPPTPAMRWARKMIGRPGRGCRRR